MCNLLENANLSNSGGTGLEIAPGEVKTLLQVNGAEDNQADSLTFSGYFVDPGSPVSPFIRAKWGTGGTQSEVQIDFTRGVVFSLHGSFFRIDVENPAASPVSVIVGISAACRRWSNVVPVTRTIDVNETIIPGDGSSPIPIPPYAKAGIILIDTPLIAAPGLPSYDIRFLPFTGWETFRDTNINYSNSRFLIPNGANELNIFNRNLVDLRVRAVIFELAL